MNPAKTLEPAFATLHNRHVDTGLRTKLKSERLHQNQNEWCIQYRGRARSVSDKSSLKRLAGCEKWSGDEWGRGAELLGAEVHSAAAALNLPLHRCTELSLALRFAR
jgi:hypothetical protein